MVWIIAGHAPGLGFLTYHFRSCLHADVHVSQVRYKQDGIEIDGELQADVPVFGAERTEV